MNSTKRPVSIIVLSCLYIVVGATGFAYHFSELVALQPYSLWIELVELIGIIAGTSMLLGRNWGRWLALAWIAFHVAVSFPVVRQVAIHSAILLAIAWILFRPDVRQYFSARPSDETR
jgi:hypothetical protein